jgi:TolA-binding protein
MKTTPNTRKAFTKTLITLAAMATLSAPALVNAQPQSRHDQPQNTQPQNHDQRGDQRGPQDRGGQQTDGRNLDRRIDDLRARIDSGKQTHRLNRNEARRMTSRLNDIASLKRSYERHGLTNREVQTLNNKLDALNGQLRFDRH